MFFGDRSTSTGTSPPNGVAAPVVADPPKDLWDAWRSAADAAACALRDWYAAATAADRATRHAAYMAAAEREAHAARVLARRLGTVPVVE
jgi:hypothetical protein